MQEMQLLWLIAEHLLSGAVYRAETTEEIKP